MSKLSYKYNTIKEFNQPGDYNFYGVIYDSTFPVYEEKENGYQCTIKLIDPDVNCLTNPNNLQDNLINLIVKSSDKESLPFIHSIGDIIRVHRGYYKYKKKKNVYLNLTNIMKIKSSWCIFQGASDLNSKDYSPIACSSNTFTFENQDKIKIDNLRSWIRIHFNSKNSLFYGKEFKLGSRNLSHPGDNDVLVQVVYKTELDDKVVYFVQDETDGCELHAYKYFNFVEVNDVIRLRSFKVFDRNVILMNNFSNILKIPPFSDLYKDMINKIALKMKSISEGSDVPMFNQEEKRFDDLMMVETPTNWGISALVEESRYQIKTLNELEDNDEKFILHLNVLNVNPQPIYELVQIMCQKCQLSQSTKETDEFTSDNKFNCKHCKSLEQGKLYFNAALVCRENHFSNRIVTIYVSTYDNEGNGFFGIAPVDLFRNSNEYQKLKDITQKLTEMDCFISVLVEAIKTGHSDTDRIYRIIGDYQNNLALN